jgi:hypothetical protein
VTAPVPVEALVPRLEGKENWLLEELAVTGSQGAWAAAEAFAVALADSVRNPQVSSVNTELPGHPTPVALPPHLQVVAMAADGGRDGVTGFDVGPSVPDVDGRVWVAVFLGAGGPLGGVEVTCVGVALRSDGVQVIVDVEALPGVVLEQPRSRRDGVMFDCGLNLRSSNRDPGAEANV